MARLQRKSFTTPEQVRRFPNGRMDMVQLDETVFGHLVLEPGASLAMASRSGPAHSGTTDTRAPVESRGHPRLSF